MFTVPVTLTNFVVSLYQANGCSMSLGVWMDRHLPYILKKVFMNACMYFNLLNVILSVWVHNCVLLSVVKEEYGLLESKQCLFASADYWSNKLRAWIPLKAAPTLSLSLQSSIKRLKIELNSVSVMSVL